MTTYGETTFWVGLVTVSWSMILAGIVKLTTTRSLRQIGASYASVWPTGFAQGDRPQTLAVNVVSAETDLGLSHDIAEAAVVFGTVMNKSCATMSVLLVTISVGRLLNVPLSLVEILTLIPPVLILGLESPGIPGGAAFFMSPIVAVLLGVPDVDAFVATFVTMYSGLIPMFSTAGNTTNDGLVGALLNDRFLSPARLPGTNPLPSTSGCGVADSRRRAAHTTQTGRLGFDGARGMDARLASISWRRRGWRTAYERFLVLFLTVYRSPFTVHR